MHDDDRCDDWRCAALSNPVLYLAAGFMAVFLFLRLALSLWIFYEQLRMAQQHDHMLSSASQDSETNGMATNDTMDHVHQRERELESVNGGGEASNCKEAKVPNDRVLVIMAGHDKPTFLATPM